MCYGTLKVFTRFTSKEKLEEKLAEVNEKILYHKLREGPIAEAAGYIEALKEEGKNSKEIDNFLISKELPTLNEVGKETLFNLYGWGLLNKKRVTLEKRIKLLNTKISNHYSQNS